MAKRSRAKAPKHLSQECDCPRCRLMDAIFTIAGEDRGDGPVEINQIDLCMDLVPTLGFLAAALDYESCEEWWRIILEARARAMSADADRMPAIKGRA